MRTLLLIAALLYFAGCGAKVACYDPIAPVQGGVLTFNHCTGTVEITPLPKVSTDQVES